MDITREKRPELQIMPNTSSAGRVLVPSTRSFSFKELALDALKRALRIRKAHGIELYAPLCPFDLAKEMGVEVRFTNVSSMEGMYHKDEDNPAIFVASERPSGRQTYSCAHELGHHVYGHGTSLDELLGQEVTRNHGAGGYRRTEPKEFSADAFAGFLLMPRATVDRAFARRGFDVQTATPEQIYLIADALGVGYLTLIIHLRYSLRLLKPDHTDDLKRHVTKLAKIRQNLAGVKVKHITVADEAWEGRPVDLHTNGHIIVPLDWEIVGDAFVLEGVTSPEAICQGNLFRVVRQGEGIMRTPEGRDLTFRVSRQGFEGRSIYRHLDDPDEETI